MIKIELNKIVRDVIGRQWKIICIDKINLPIGRLILVNKEQNFSYILTYEQVYGNLIEYIGDNFTEEKHFEDNIKR